MTLFEALRGGAFDCLNWQHSGVFDQNFWKKSNARGFAQGGWAVLELTGTYPLQETKCQLSGDKFCCKNFCQSHQILSTIEKCSSGIREVTYFIGGRVRNLENHIESTTVVVLRILVANVMVCKMAQTRTEVYSNACLIHAFTSEVKTYL